MNGLRDYEVERWLTLVCGRAECSPIVVDHGWLDRLWRLYWRNGKWPLGLNDDQDRDYPLQVWGRDVIPVYDSDRPLAEEISRWW